MADATLDLGVLCKSEWHFLFSVREKNNKFRRSLTRRIGSDCVIDRRKFFSARTEFRIPGCEKILKKKRFGILKISFIGVPALCFISECFETAKKYFFTEKQKYVE